MLERKYFYSVRDELFEDGSIFVKTDSVAQTLNSNGISYPFYDSEDTATMDSINASDTQTLWREMNKISQRLASKLNNKVEADGSKFMLHYSFKITGMGKGESQKYIPFTLQFDDGQTLTALAKNVKNLKSFNPKKDIEVTHWLINEKDATEAIYFDSRDIDVATTVNRLKTLVERSHANFIANNPDMFKDAQMLNQLQDEINAMELDLSDVVEGGGEEKTYGEKIADMEERKGQSINDNSVVISDLLGEISSSQPKKDIYESLKNVATKINRNLSHEESRTLETFLIGVKLPRFEDVESVESYLKMKTKKFLFNKAVLDGSVGEVLEGLRGSSYILGKNPFDYHKSGLIVSTENMGEDIEKVFMDKFILKDMGQWRLKEISPEITPENISEHYPTMSDEEKPKAIKPFMKEVILLWSEASGVENKRFKTFNDLQRFIREEYDNDPSKLNTDGTYDKHKITIFYSDNESLTERIDVAGKGNDFNPFTMNLSEYVANFLEVKNIKIEENLASFEPKDSKEPKEESIPNMPKSGDDRPTPTPNVIKGTQSSLNTIRGLNNGTEKEYDKRLFVSSIVNKIKTKAKNNENDEVIETIDYIEAMNEWVKKQGEKALITSRSPIWKMREKIVSEEDKKTYEEKIADMEERKGQSIDEMRQDEPISGREKTESVLQRIKDNDIYKKIVKNSFGGAMFNVSDANKYDISEIWDLWSNHLTDSEKNNVDGVLKGVFGFIKDEYSEESKSLGEAQENPKISIEINATTADEFEKKLDKLVDDLEATGQIEEYEDELNALLDRLAKMMKSENE